MTKRFSFLMFVFTSLFHQLLAQEETFVKKLADINMPSFGWENRQWDAHTMREYLETHMKYRLFPTAKAKREKGFAFYTEREKNALNKTDDMMKQSVLLDMQSTWQDLTLFCGQTDKSVYVADVLCRTRTELGKVAQFLLLASPTNNVEKLRKRQDVIRAIASNTDMFEALNQLFESMELPEIVFLSFYDQDSLKQTVRNQCEIPIDILKPLNKSSALLLLKSWYSHATRLSWVAGSAAATVACGLYGLSHIIGSPASPESWISDWTTPGYPTRLVWNRANNVGRTAIALGTAAFLGFGLEPTMLWMQDCFFFEECLHVITNHLATFINSARHAYETVNTFPELAAFDEFKGLINFFDKDIKESHELQEFCELLATDTFRSAPSMLANKGRIIRAFLFMHEIKEKLIPLAEGIGALDCYLGYAKLIKENEAKKVGFCFPTYVKAEKPQLELSHFWHPLIDEERVVTNEVKLGNGARRNMLITGPNAGGKSTILKSISLCILLAQTIGIAPASRMEFTLFDAIKTYLNIVDDIGAGNSLFMAEAKQAQRILDMIEKSNKSSFTFTCFDEVFNGTSPVEGSAAAYSVASHLGRYDNSMCIIATHFPVLTKLEGASSSFKNYKVSVAQCNGALQYPYKLEEGISRQHVALDVLKEQGFAGSLLDEAQALVDDPHILQS